jgi:hypothetical protein
LSSENSLKVFFSVANRLRLGRSAGESTEDMGFGVAKAAGLTNPAVWLLTSFGHVSARPHAAESFLWSTPLG